jgi:hypothetical protein
MPDHLHLLVGGTAEMSDLRRFSKLAKQRSGAEYALNHGAALWQEGYHDRVLRDEDDTRAIAPTYSRTLCARDSSRIREITPSADRMCGRWTSYWMASVERSPGPKGPGLQLNDVRRVLSDPPLPARC